MATAATSTPANWQLAIAGLSLSTTLAVVGIAVSVSNHDQVVWLTGTSIVLGGLAVGFFAAGLHRMLMLVRRLPLGHRSHFKVGIHAQRWASSVRDVADAHEFLARLLPQDPPSLALMQGLFERNPQCVRIIDSERDDKRTIVGMYVVAPMNRRAVEAFRGDTVTSLDMALLNRAVPRTWRQAHGVYIGGIAGSTPAGRAWALSGIEWFLQQSGAKTVFARPVSPDGERVLKSTGFIPVSDGSAFWYRDL